MHFTLRYLTAGVMCLFLALTLSACHLAGTPEPALPLSERPNIVFIVVEDMSMRVNAFGDEVAVTPNIDRLAAEGVRFDHAFTTAPVCSPSRTGLILGMPQQSVGGQNHRTRTFGRNMEEGFPYLAVPPANVKAFPEVLRRAGYYTVNNSKTDFQFGNAQSIWDANGSNASWNTRAEGQPFFMMVSDEITHEGKLFRYDREPENEIQARAAERNRRELEGEPIVVSPEDVIVPPFYPDTPEVRQDIARQYNNIFLMDRNVGDLVDRLEADGLLDNTIIIWTTDHGDGLPRYKRALYDTGIQVPMVVRFPDGRMAGTVRDDLVSFVDLAPTILAMAGVESPDYFVGHDIFDPQLPPREYVFAARDRFDEKPDRGRAVRDDHYKYIRNFDPDRPFYADLAYRNNIVTMQELWRLYEAGELTEQQASYFRTPRPAVELYDLDEDPYEIRNLAGDEAYAAVEARLGSVLEDWIETTGDTGRIPEIELAEMFWPDGVQPVTAPPVATYLDDSSGLRVDLQSETPGASIEYAYVDASGGADGNWHAWHLYTGPVPVEPGKAIEARAIRYGYKTSEVVRLTR